MEFWGVEFKAREPFKVQPDFGMVVHFSQACLGETKDKGNEVVYLNLNIDDKKSVIGNLSLDKNPHMQFDLVFEKDFELSHNWKNGSIYFYGYQKAYGEHDDVFSGDDDLEKEEELDLANIQEALAKEKGNLDKSNIAKLKSSKKAKVRVVEPSKDDEDDSNDDDEGFEDDSNDDMLDGSDDEEDSKDEDKEETPKKVLQSKKRSNDSAVKTPTNKEAKVASPKSDGKKGVHVATLHPTKKGGKTPDTDKKPQQTPKSTGSVICKSYNKTFQYDKALEFHNKVKHA
ncbi:hypothetical protein UlMin_035290 [Ulmus minor]